MTTKKNLNKDEECDELSDNKNIMWVENLH